MFTGIIETVGTVVSITKEYENMVLVISSSLSNELKVDQSVAHNGICLTVTAVNEKTHTVSAVPETIQKTTIGNWKAGDFINLERCLPLNGRLDGHIVQGHVDTSTPCILREDFDQHWIFTFSLASEFAHLVIEKGSIAINGTSLTCFNVTKSSFQVTIIPYTFEHTSIQHVYEKTPVNIEFDIVGKYLARMQELK